MEGTKQYSVAGNVRVLARVRPALAHEYQYDQAVEVLSARQIKLQNAKQSYASTYDRVLPESSSQELVYAQVQDCVQSLLLGYNNTLLAYGQTGTGKTYTMIGDQSMTLAQACSIPSSASGHGILPRAVFDLFSELDRRKAAAASRQQQYNVRLVCSYLEIYNDRLYDLLQPYKKGSNRDPHRMQLGKTSLEVREDPVAGTHVPNLLYVDVQNFRQVLQLVATGNSNRATAHTDMNRHSSRSHAILQLWLEQRPSVDGSDSIGTAKDSTAGGVVVRSKMNFVDLAGSERWGKAHNETGDTTLVSELTSINSSLSALALVVAALTDKTARHIPYRSSRLTHLLQDSLGGNCNTTLLVTVAPCVNAFEGSIAALTFADRARNISNRAVVNSMHDTETILALKEREIQRLRALLASYTSAPGAAGPGAQSPWQQWVHEGVAGQDALMLPITHPSTPNSPTTNTSPAPQHPHSPVLSSHSRSSPLSGTSPAEGSSSVATGATVAAGAGASASEAAAIDKAQLESELAATRVALALERTMRSALEGQLQEVSAAVQAQQQAAAVAAAAAQAEQQAAAATAAAATRKSLSPTVLSSDCYNDLAVRPSDPPVSDSSKITPGVEPVIRTGRSTLLAHSNTAATSAVEPVASLQDPTWPVLSSPKQLQGHKQQPPEHNTQQQQQHIYSSSTKKQKGPIWNANWQGSAEERIRASHHQQHKQQDCGKKDSHSRRSSAASPAEVIEPDRSRSPAGKESKGTSKVGSGKSGPESGANMPLRNSWSEAYGASSGLRGRWPQSTTTAAKAAGRNRAASSSKALGRSPAGFYTAREPAVVATTTVRGRGQSIQRYHSDTADDTDPTAVASGPLEVAGTLKGPQRSVSHGRLPGRTAAVQAPGPNSLRPLMQYNGAAGKLSGGKLLPMVARHNPNALRQSPVATSNAAVGQLQHGHLSTSVTAAQVLTGLLQQHAAAGTSYAGPAEQPQQHFSEGPLSKGWGRSSLLLHSSLQSQTVPRTVPLATTAPAAVLEPPGTAVPEASLQQPDDTTLINMPCTEDDQQQRQQSGDDQVGTAIACRRDGLTDNYHEEGGGQLPLEAHVTEEQLKIKTIDPEVPETPLQEVSVASASAPQQHLEAQQGLQDSCLEAADEQVDEQYSEDFGGDEACDPAEMERGVGVPAAVSEHMSAEPMPMEEVACVDDPVTSAGSLPLSDTECGTNS